MVKAFSMKPLIYAYIVKGSIKLKALVADRSPRHLRPHIYKLYKHL